MNQMIRGLAAIAAGVLAAALATAAADASTPAPFAVQDSGTTLVTTAPVFNGEVIAHDGIAHTVTGVHASYGVSSFHLTNPLLAGTAGVLTFVQV